MSVITIKTGDVVEGRVTAIEACGIVVSIGYKNRGLIRPDEVRWERGGAHADPQVGERISALVIKTKGGGHARFNCDLSIKQLTPNPYYELGRKYPEGTHLKCSIAEINDHGLQLKIESETTLAWAKKSDIEEEVGISPLVGKVIDVVMLKTKEDAYNVRCASPKKYLENYMRISVDDDLVGTVTEILKDGRVVVLLPNNTKGVLKPSTVQSSQFKEMCGKVKVGSTVKVFVLDKKKDNKGNIALSIRAIWSKRSV